MNYSAIASTLRGVADSFSNELTNIKETEFDSIWKGMAHDTLTNNLTLSLSSLKEQINAINTYSDVLDLVQEYKTNKETIDNYNYTISSLDSEENANTISNYRNEISNLSSKNETLKEQIQSKLNSITVSSQMFTDKVVSINDNTDSIADSISNAAEDYNVSNSVYFASPIAGNSSNTYSYSFNSYSNNNAASYSSSGYSSGGGGSYSSNSNSYNIKNVKDVNFSVGKNDDEFVVDLKKLLKQYRSGKLTKLPDGQSLYQYVSKKSINNYLSEIKKKYSGREAAVNCVLGAMAISASVGKKLDYDYGGGHGSVTSTDNLMNGVDCSAFASWAINQGTSNTFGVMTSTSFHNLGTHESFSKAKPGDILVRGSSGNGGHVAIIIQNDPKNKTFLIAEAYSDQEGIILSSKSYSSCAAFEARDLSNIYD